MQLTLDLNLTLNDSINRADFITGPFNQECITFLFNKFNSINEKVVFIYGASAVGKSYITKLYIKENQGLIISLKDINSISKIDYIIKKSKLLLLEDIDILKIEDEKNMFHLYNMILSNNTKLILTAKNNPNDLKLQLLDLKSRLLSINIIKIKEPDIKELRYLLFKMFQDNQLNVSVSIVDYILNRIERKASKMQSIVKEIHKIVSTTKKNVTINLVKEII